MRFSGEYPGVAHVAVERRLEIEQHEAQLMHLAAEPLAGEPVGQLVQDGGAEDGQPDQEEGLHPIELGGISLNLVPIQQGEAKGEEDEACGAQQKGGGKAEPEFGQQPGEEAIRVEGLQPKVKQISLDSSGCGPRRLAGSGLRFQESELLQPIHKALERIRGARLTQVCFGPLANDLKWRGTVELLCDELLRLPKAEILSGHWVLEHEGGSLSRLLPAMA